MDESRAREYQDAYYSGDTAAYDRLYAEVRRMSLQWVGRFQAKKRLSLSDYDRDRIAGDSATRLMMQYIKHPGYKVYSFYHRIELEVFRVMFGGSTSRKREVNDAATAIPDDVPDRQEEPKAQDDPMAAILAEPEGKRVVIDLARARSYRGAVLTIAAYSSRRWIYDHAEALHTVFRMTRWPPRSHTL